MTTDEPVTDIEVGTLFSWGDRPVLTIENQWRPVHIHDGYIVMDDRPRHWWDLRTWVRVCRKLWAMPYNPPDSHGNRFYRNTGWSVADHILDIEGLDTTGATDMAPTIQAQIDAAPHAAVIRFPPGTIRLDRNIGAG